MARPQVPDKDPSPGTARPGLGPHRRWRIMDRATLCNFDFGLFGWLSWLSPRPVCS
jgi:hypothetical protein